MTISELKRNYNFVEFHCHGIGKFDFSEISNLDLSKINEIAKSENLYLVPTIFLSYEKLSAFIDLLKKYNEIKNDLTHILGFGMEGPLLGGVGGTPSEGTWIPTRKEWEKLFECGELGLSYMVYSSDSQKGLENYDYNMDWVTENLIRSGIRPALGHFQHSDPLNTANTIQNVLEVVRSITDTPLHTVVLTDHLLNDMPRNVKHAWRLPCEKKNRNSEFKDLKIETWTLQNLDEKLGVVPATLIKEAYHGNITVCMNFDGEHVDLEICKKIYELIGPEYIIAMTDRTDINVLGEQQLENVDGSALWYQKEGKVAASTTTIFDQVENLKALSIPEEDIKKMVCTNPLKVLDLKRSVGIR